MEDLPTTSASLAVGPLNTVLAAAAIALLVFVSAGVLYLSTVEWRDRRRRGRPTSAKR